MDWDAIGAAGEILGAFAVLITVGYLAIQVRQGAHAVKSSKLESANEAYRMSEGSEHERYVRCLDKWQRNEELTWPEIIHVVERFMTIVRIYEGRWYQDNWDKSNQGGIDHDIDVLRWIFGPPVARLIWEHVGPMFDSQFQALIASEVLAESAPTSPMLSAVDALIENQTSTP